jgi:hypothetical protein
MVLNFEINPFFVNVVLYFAKLFVFLMEYRDLHISNQSLQGAVLKKLDED